MYAVTQEPRCPSCNGKDGKSPQVPSVKDCGIDSGTSTTEIFCSCQKEKEKLSAPIQKIPRTFYLGGEIKTKAHKFVTTCLARDKGQTEKSALASGGHWRSYTPEGTCKTARPASPAEVGPRPAARGDLSLSAACSPRGVTVKLHKPLNVLHCGPSTPWNRAQS